MPQRFQIFISTDYGAPVSKPCVTWQWEEGEEPCVSVREISMGAHPDWNRRAKGKKSLSSQGIFKELFQIALVEKHFQDVLWSSKLKTACGCDDFRSEKQQIIQRNWKEISSTHKSTTPSKIMNSVNLGV